MNKETSHLIIVPGHAAFKDSVSEAPPEPMDDRYWVLQSFQAGEPSFYIEHIKRGVEELRRDSSALLLMSGGRTRQEAGHWSEAATYAVIARACGYWTDDNVVRQSVQARIGLEEFARDSLENLQCSLQRYYQLVGKWPLHITVVGWGFKEKRFDYHRQTLRIPKKRFAYVGCNNPSDLSGALKGEERALQAFHQDPGAEREPLHTKRLERNPFHVPNSYTDVPPIRIA